jgi:hypothetical protein
MAEQPNFDQLARSYHDVAYQIGLITNLPALQDRQLIQNNHNEMMRALQDIREDIRGVHTRMDRLETRMDRLETRLAAK